MAKKKPILSRDEEIQEQWLKYFENVKIENEFIRLLLEYFKDFIEPTIKKEWDLALNYQYGKKEDNYWSYESVPDIPDDKLRMVLLSVGSIIADFKEYCDSKDGRYNYQEDEYINNFEELKKELENIANSSESIIESINKNYYLTSLYINNFKGFSEDNEEKDNTINIKPITLLYGPNSFGKSSILQTLLMLNQTAKEKDYKNIGLYPGGADDIVNLGGYQDFISNHDTNKILTIKLTLPYKQPQSEAVNYIKHLLVLKKRSLAYNFKFKDDIIILASIDVFQNIIDYSDINNPIEKELDKIHYDLEKIDETNPIEKISHFTVGEKDNHYYFLDSHQEMFQGIDEIIENIVYVSSYRKVPDRVFKKQQRYFEYVGKYGEDTFEILKDNKNKDILEKVNEWLYTIAGYNLSAPKKSHQSYDTVSLDDKTTKVTNINLLDLGSGIAQVLPVITQAFKSKEQIVLIEEPEIHLHPKAQAELGSMFVDAVKEKNNIFIIETHSENLLLRLEKLIRNGKLSKDDVSIIYVHKDEKGSHCIPLELNDKGDITNTDEVPKGFFEEVFYELFDIEKE